MNQAQQLAELRKAQRINTNAELIARHIEQRINAHVKQLANARILTQSIGTIKCVKIEENH